ncbi:MAG: NBR1-Ig-like domain-containing protein [Anaerolineaceae bacterium]|nr:NBR1-Ig-like domain-containing protein [Anaerolineaceae bacterium]
MKKSAWLVALLISPLIMLAACSPAAPATPTTEPNAIYTAAAATVVYQLTRAAALVPSPTDTVEPTTVVVQDTDTPEAPALPTLAGPSTSDQSTPGAPSGAPTSQSQNSIPTLDLSAPSYQTPTTAPANGQSAGDKALWQYSVPADGSTFTPNQQFAMAIGMKNAGSFTWSKNYSFRYLGGTQMSGVTKINFNKEVKPGEKIEFDISFEAPGNTGKYITYWAVYNASGVEVAQEMYFAFNVSK